MSEKTRIIRVEVVRERQTNEPPVWFHYPSGPREPDWAFFSPFDGKTVEVTVREVIK